MENFYLVSIMLLFCVITGILGYKLGDFDGFNDGVRFGRQEIQHKNLDSFDFGVDKFEVPRYSMYQQQQ